MSWDPKESNLLICPHGVQSYSVRVPFVGAHLNLRPALVSVPLCLPGRAHVPGGTEAVPASTVATSVHARGNGAGVMVNARGGGGQPGEGGNGGLGKGECQRTKGTSPLVKLEGGAAVDASHRVFICPSCHVLRCDTLGVRAMHRPNCNIFQMIKYVTFDADPRQRSERCPALSD